MDSDYFQNIFNQVYIDQIGIDSVIAFAVAAVLLLCSGYISASEVAFFSLSPADLQKVKEKKQKHADNQIEELLSKPDYLLGTILITNNLVNVAIVTLCTYAINSWIDFSAVPIFGFILETVLLTFLLLLFGEIMPKIYAQKNALPFARRTAATMLFLEKMMRPFSSVLVSSSTVINKRISKKKNDISVDELSKALEITSPEIKEEKNMLNEIIKFYNKTADEIMTPRLDMKGLDIKSNFGEVLEMIVESGYSRIPVYDNTEDKIKGILYIKDLLPHIEEDKYFRWQTLIRPAYFVPETKKIDDLLEEFRTNKIHMAIVVDEFGGTSGLVTMEDILEEIVGDISDEYDEEERFFTRLKDGSFIFEAKIPLNDFFRVTELKEDSFGELTDEVETLAGLLLEIKGDFPKRQEIIEFGGYRFQILEVDNRRIIKVKFSVL